MVAPIVDANAHVMAADSSGQETIGSNGAARPRADVTAEEFLEYMRQAGIDHALLVPHPPSSFDNRYCLESAQRHPESFTVIGKVDVTNPTAESTLRQLSEQPGLGGLRFEAPRGADPLDWLDAPGTVALWEVAAACNLCVSVPSVRRLDHFPAIQRVLERWPTLSVALKLPAGPEVRRWLGDGGRPIEDRAESLFSLAAFPHIYFTFARLNLAAEATDESTPQAFLDAFLHHFGAGRLLWCSFFPANRDGAEQPLKRLLDDVRADLAFLSPDERDSILGETAQRLYVARRQAPV